MASNAEKNSLKSMQGTVLHWVHRHGAGTPELATTLAGYWFPFRSNTAARFFATWAQTCTGIPFFTGDWIDRPASRAEHWLATVVAERVDQGRRLNPSSGARQRARDTRDYRDQSGYTSPRPRAFSFLDAAARHRKAGDLESHAQAMYYAGAPGQRLANPGCPKCHGHGWYVPEDATHRVECEICDNGYVPPCDHESIRNGVSVYCDKPGINKVASDYHLCATHLRKRNPPRKAAQPSLFGGGEDLPLFAAAPRHKAPAPLPVNTAPFRVDDTLIMHSPHTQENTLVTYRGTMGGDSAVVWTGRTQFSVPLTWLRHQPMTAAQANYQAMLAEYNAAKDHYAKLSGVDRRVAREMLDEAMDRLETAQNMLPQRNPSQPSLFGYAPQPVAPPRPKVEKLPTYAEAQSALLKALEADGWKVHTKSAQFKKLLTPYAIPPQSQRNRSPWAVWFHTQALYSGTRENNSSLWVDVRRAPTAQLVDELNAEAAKETRWRNPSSGAKQKARGVRDFDVGIYQGKPYDYAPKGALSAAALTSAAGHRRVIKTAKLRHEAGIEKRAQATHARRLATAAANRPRLPNPANFKVGDIVYFTGDHVIDAQHAMVKAILNSVEGLYILRVIRPRAWGGTFDFEAHGYQLKRADFVYWTDTLERNFKREIGRLDRANAKREARYKEFE